MQHAGDVVEVVAEDGVARVAVLLGEGGRLGDGRLGGDRDHLGARGHHALHAEAGEADHALEHELLLRV